MEIRLETAKKMLLHLKSELGVKSSTISCPESSSFLFPKNCLGPLSSDWLKKTEVATSSSKGHHQHRIPFPNQIPELQQSRNARTISFVLTPRWVPSTYPSLPRLNFSLTRATLLVWLCLFTSSHPCEEPAPPECAGSYFPGFLRVEF